MVFVYVGQGLSCYSENPVRFKGRIVATVLCGGNLTPQQVKEWLC
jgi:threonine dehydratase